jgi:hypothetical protein
MLDALCTEPIFDTGVLCCYGENPKPWQELGSKNASKVRYHEDVSENLANAQGNVCLIIFHDLLNEMY